MRWRRIVAISRKKADTVLRLYGESGSQQWDMNALI